MLSTIAPNCSSILIVLAGDPSTASPVSPGQWAGIVVAAVVVLIAFIVAGTYIYQKRKVRKNKTNPAGETQARGEKRQT